MEFLTEKIPTYFICFVCTLTCKWIQKCFNIVCFSKVVFYWYKNALWKKDKMKNKGTEDHGHYKVQKTYKSH